MTTTSRAQGIRQQARAQMRTEILDAAREQLAAQGVGSLSVRAVARELGMASSAVYRYFENRDVLLTALIVDAYDALGETVERAEATAARDDLGGRWGRIAHSVRSWALENPSLYALVYGSPVPGYVAPPDTVGPATRVTRLLSDLLHDTLTAPCGPPTFDALSPLEPPAAEGVAPLLAYVGPSATPESGVRGLMAWTWLFGAVSFEVFGQLTDTVLPQRREDVFDAEVQRVGQWLGLHPDARL